jgi:hypothetical protein
MRPPAKPASQVIAVVKAVRDAPPPAFAGGGKWGAMHGEMAGIYEVRCRQGDQLHWLFCLLDRNHPDGPALVMLDGDSKPNRTAMPESVYHRSASTGTPTSTIRPSTQLAASICSTEVSSRIWMRSPRALATATKVAKVGFAADEVSSRRRDAAFNSALAASSSRVQPSSLSRSRTTFTTSSKARISASSASTAPANPGSR